MIDSRVIAEEGGWCYLLASHPIYKSFYGIPSPSSVLQCVLGWMSVSYAFLSSFLMHFFCLFMTSISNPPPLFLDVIYDE